MPSTISTDVRGTLATALASVAGNVYSYVPEAIIPPAVVIVPSSPYMEINLIGNTSIKLLLNYTITVAVAYNSNPGSLDNLEQLILQILAVIPSGYIVGQIDRPTVTSVGASNVLAADINVSTYYTQTN